MTTAIESAFARAKSNEAGSHGLEKPHKQRTPTKQLERLKIRDNHALCTFLLSYKFQPGQTFDDVAADANVFMGVQIINKGHVQHRMQEFNLKLIPGRPNDNARLDLLEGALRALIDYVEDTSGGSFSLLHNRAEIQEFLKSFG